MANRLKEIEMQEALNKWKQISPDQLQQNIRSTQVN
jgi:hypothetical protein